MDGFWQRYRGYAVMSVLFVIVFIGTVWTLRRDDEPVTIAVTTAIPRATPTPEMVVVHLCGAVANPGVYTLPEGSRVQDALKLAGDVQNGDTSALNLARRLNDGEQICVPKVGEAVTPGTALTARTPTVASGCLSFKDASAHLNETTCVRGTVTSAEKSGSNFFIYFDDTSTSFYAISFSHTWDNLRNKCVEINGKIALFRGRAQIVIDKLEQLSFCR